MQSDAITNLRITNQIEKIILSIKCDSEFKYEFK
jgi:hypothetical protein